MNEQKQEIKQLQAINRKLNRKNRKRTGKRRVVRRNITQQLSRIGLSTGDSSGYNEPLEPTGFRKIPRRNLLSAMQTYHNYTKSRYLMGLVHPDIAVREQIPLKLYSDIPIPTASIGFHEQYQFTTNASGNFLLTWLPNFLVTQNYLTINSLANASHLSFNNAVGLNGTTVVAGNSYVAGSYYPAVDIQRYRMVSALLKISYNGNILNQAGTFISCATFDSFNAVIGTVGQPVTGYSNVNADRFGVFSLISNGLWNKTQNITKDSEGIECLYVPIDPDDLMFQKTASFYGYPPPNTAGILPPDSEGAHINYVVAGRNLPVNSACIIVDIYYNYEVIADPSSAPILRSDTNNVFTAKENRQFSDSVSDMIKANGLIRPAQNNHVPTVFEKILQTSFEYLPMLLKTFM